MQLQAIGINPNMKGIGFTGLPGQKVAQAHAKAIGLEMDRLRVQLNEARGALEIGKIQTRLAKLQAQLDQLGK